MEKPAVIFSEQGFKMFLDFVKGMQGQEPSKEDNSVDALVRDFYARDDKPVLGKVEEVPAEPLYDMTDVAKLLQEHMSEFPGQVMDVTAVHDFLWAHGFHYPKRSIGPVMVGVLKRATGIKRVDRGVWTYEA